MSWARSTVASVERSLGRSDHLFDRILVGVLALLAFAVVFLFVARPDLVASHRVTERCVVRPADDAGCSDATSRSAVQ